MTVAELDDLVAALSDSDRSLDLETFARQVADYRDSGLYSWWADDEARTAIGRALDVEVARLIYVGQAGATKWPSGKASTATIASRIGEQHMRGDISSSTFRKTLAAILSEDLSLEVADTKRLTRPSNAQLSAWIAQHLRVVPVVVPDRAKLGKWEAAIVATLDPPLNLDHVPATAPRRRLKALRAALVPTSLVPVPPPSVDLTEPELNVEIVNPEFGWLLRIEPADAIAFDNNKNTPPTVIGVMDALTERLPEVAKLAREHKQLRVVFSPEIRKLLSTGQARLMQTGIDTLPTAIDLSGKIVGTARVVPDSAVAAAGGGIALGAIGAVAWPVALAAAVGAAAAISHQRWLEQTFGELEASMRRIEARLRDDDAGMLIAALSLVEAVEPSVLSGALAPQLCHQLAAAQFEVDRVHAARRLFVDRWKQALESAQNAAAAKKGSVSPWVGDVAAELADRRTGVLDEIVLFLQATIVRARLTVCTAAVISAEGDGATAMHLLHRLEEETRRDYHDLNNRVRALATYGPESARWKQMIQNFGGAKIPLLRGGSDARAQELMQTLHAEMKRTIGDALPERDRVLEIVIESRSLASISA